jgi:hydroxybutyrate-dimer hydrolase
VLGRVPKYDAQAACAWYGGGMHRLRVVPAVIAATLLLASCASHEARPGGTETAMFEHARTTIHRGDDDLLSAGLGLDGLRAAAPPAFADAGAPTGVELRRRAIWSNWRGIADLAPGGGLGSINGTLGHVPGREFSALARLPGAMHPHRLLVQVPDGFDARSRCVVVAAASGSRGVYGAIALAGVWGLPRGCAVAYTDKAAGTDYFDLDAGLGVRADGSVGGRESGDLAFAPDAQAAARGVAVKHAHSGDNPEADWGRHVRQAAEFALASLDTAFPAQAPFTFDNTRVIATGISNGGGAVLRAAELDGDWLDAVVAGEPNIHVDGFDSRPLYDYATEAALLMPCALLHLDGLPQPPLAAQSTPLWRQRCASLRDLGLVDGADAGGQARSAYRQLRSGGWTDEALRAGALSVAFDIWRAVAVTYASAHGRYPPGAHPCGHAFSAQAGDGTTRPASTAERAAWWADAGGIPPGAGVGIIPPANASPDAALAELRCLRDLWVGRGNDAARVHAGVDGIRASPPREGLPVVIVHGLDDGLIPAAFSSDPYVAMARASGRDVRYWQVHHAQHFDAFLGFPDYAARYLPLLPYVHAALDRVWDHLEHGAPLPGDAVIKGTPRGPGVALERRHLALPR